MYVTIDNFASAVLSKCIAFVLYLCVCNKTLQADKHDNQLSGRRRSEIYDT